MPRDRRTASRTHHRRRRAFRAVARRGCPRPHARAVAGAGASPRGRLPRRHPVGAHVAGRPCRGAGRRRRRHARVGRASASAARSRRSRAVPSTSVARGLQAVADEEDALAIVVGPSHRGALGRVIPGSVGERLLRSAPCPVAVAPSGYRSAQPGAVRRIGVGFTPEPEADEALAAAVGIAARTGAAIQVLSVVEPPSAVVLGFAWGYGELEQTARDDLAGSLAGTIGRGCLPSRDRRRGRRRLRRRRARQASRRTSTC